MKKANGITVEKNSSARSVAQSRKTLFLGFGELPPNKQNENLAASGIFYYENNKVLGT